MIDFIAKRKSQRLKSLCFLLLIFFCANSTIFFMGRTLIPLAPADGVLSPAPYGYKGPCEMDFPYTKDAGGAFNISYAYDAYTVSSLKKGSLPFWNPYQGLGQPFLANGQSAVLYPINWLMLILPPNWWDMIWLINWFLAALFFYLFLDFLGIEPLVALIGTVGVLSSGYFQMNLAQREILAVAAWWPLLLYAVEHTIKVPTWRHRHWILAIAVYCSVTAGQPEVTFLSLFSVLLYVLIRLTQTKEHRWATFLALIPGSLGGLLLAAPLWVNFSAYAFPAYSVHGADSKVGLIYFRYKSTVEFLFPYVYGFSDGPMWEPGLLIFLAFVSIGSLHPNPGKGQIFFTTIAMLTLAKFCGVPVINQLGSLPLFERINFIYGGFLLKFAVSGMAVYGLLHLYRLKARQWQFWLAGWSLFCLAVLILGIRPIWGHLQKSGLLSYHPAIFAIFGGLGLVWAISAPLALFWLRRQRPNEEKLFYLLTGIGILWQGIAFFPRGSQTITISLTLLYLLIFLLTVFLAARSSAMVSYGNMVAYGLMVTALLPIVSCFLFPNQGLARRYDPLTSPTYVRQLQRIQENGIFRSFSFDSAPAPNFAAPFGLSNLGVLEPLIPLEAAVFIRTYLNQQTDPLTFASNIPWWNSHDPMEELRQNLRYYSLVSTKYILGQDSDPLTPPFYNTEAWGYPKESKLLTEPLEFSLFCPANVLARVDVVIPNAELSGDGTVALRIIGPDGSLERIVNIPSRSLKRRDFQTAIKFIFSPITGLKNQKIRLQLSFSPSGPKSRLSIYYYPKSPDLGFACRLYSVPGTPETYPLVYEDPETKVKIWENPEAIPRLFLATEARIANSWDEAIARLKDTTDLARQVWLLEGPPFESSWDPNLPAGKILNFHLDPNNVIATFEAYTPGILTLTDSYSPGWRVSINGKEVPTLLVDGVFRGVRLHGPGTYELKYHYRPPYWNQTLWLAFIGASLILIASRNKS